ncbi:hypothetical protein SAMN04490204_1044 [Pseudomonas thivervalensis]|nr:hypothetical protein SAMN04490204_1044 [Pseudomonas thivervalensis]
MQSLINNRPRRAVNQWPEQKYGDCARKRYPSDADNNDVCFDQTAPRSPP